jgi:DNA mismatch repair protein MutL
MGKDDPRVIEELLEQYKTQSSDLKLNKRDTLAFSLSKYASIKLGKKLHDDEMQSLIDQLFACEQPHFSPDGKAIFVSISIEDIKNFFEQ